ncbi:unnamed protein product [Cuscuta campestris]|uniref:Uncharacterized protein n=1 Tax=Cuscuta campestris TaxID=132261 RepID=A0A484KG29_9ASTE|nr:unnamed protein product [Cuscuta campestris]
MRGSSFPFYVPHCMLRVVRPSCRQERRSGNHKSLQCSSINRTLASWEDGSGFSDLVSSLMDSPRVESSSGKEARDGDSAISSNVRGVSSPLLVPFITSLPPDLPSLLLSKPALVVDKDCVLRCTKLFLLGSRLEALRRCSIVINFDVSSPTRLESSALVMPVISSPRRGTILGARVAFCPSSKA